MADMFSPRAQAVLVHLQANSGADETAQEVAAATGIEPKAITGVLNGLQRKGMIVREEATDADGKTVKYIRLTAEGTNADPAAEKPSA